MRHNLSCVTLMRKSACHIDEAGICCAWLGSLKLGNIVNVVFWSQIFYLCYGGELGLRTPIQI